MAGETWRIIRLRWRNHWRLMLAVAVLATGLSALGWRLGWLEQLERSAYDKALTRYTGGRGVSPNVVLVSIDQETLDGVRANSEYLTSFGSWPYSRNIWARVLQQLEHEGARAVVFDAVMDEPNSDPSTDLAFAQVLRETRVPFYLGVATHVESPRLPKAEPGPPRAEPSPSDAPRPTPSPAQATRPSPATADGPTPPPTEPPTETADAPAVAPETFPDDGAPGGFPETEEVFPQVTPEQVARALAFPARTTGPGFPSLEVTSPLGAQRMRNPLSPIAPLVEAVDGFGLVDMEPDPDGSMRRTRFVYSDGANTYPTLPVRVAAGLFGARELSVTGRTLRLGDHTYAVDPDGGAAIDYGGTLDERFRSVSLLRVLDAWNDRELGKPPTLLPKDFFRGKVVLIGGNALGLNDVKAMPFATSTPGMVKQAAVLDNLLTGRFITRAPLAVSVAFTFLLALVSVVLLMTTRWTALEIIWPVALYGGLFLVTGVFLATSHTHVLTAMPAVGGVLASLAAVAFNHLVANREAEFIRQAFSRFMEPKLVEQMIEERELPRLDGENVEISAFFSDIKGFSTFSERFKEDPRQLVRILNTYLTRVSGALLREGGCLDKYIGDAVVCLFGVPRRQPDHAVRACKGALAVKAEVDKLRADFRAQGLPDVYTRIGVNSAVNFVGNFGSEQLFSYTAIGDGMNLAARLEGANKAYGSVIMIGSRTYELAREHIEVRELDRVRVAGKTEAVTVYELLALKGGVDARKRTTVERYHAALALYREARFAEAASVLEARRAEDPEDGPTQALLERCLKYSKAPPSEFDGVANLDK